MTEQKAGSLCKIDLNLILIVVKRKATKRFLLSFSWIEPFQSYRRHWIDVPTQPTDKEPQSSHRMLLGDAFLFYAFAEHFAE